MLSRSALAKALEDTPGPGKFTALVVGDPPQGNTDTKPGTLPAMTATVPKTPVAPAGEGRVIVRTSLPRKGFDAERESYTRVGGSSERPPPVGAKAALRSPTRCTAEEAMRDIPWDGFSATTAALARMSRAA